MTNETVLELFFFVFFFWVGRAFGADFYVHRPVAPGLQMARDWWCCITGGCHRLHCHPHNLGRKMALEVQIRCQKYKKW